MLPVILPIALFALFIFLIYICAVSEYASFSLSADDLKALAIRDDPAGKWLSERLRKPREFALFYVVIRTMLVTLTALSVGAFIFFDLNKFTIIISALIFWVAFLLFGFAFPGSASGGNRLDKALRLVPLLRMFRVILAPITYSWKKLLGVLAPEGGIGGPLAIERELDNIIPDEQGFASLETEEKEMIRHVVEFGDTTVREVMVPRIDMVCIPVNSNFDHAIKIIFKEGHSRIPLYEDRIDNIVGILYAKDLLLELRKSGEDADLRKIAREPYYVPEAKRTLDLLREFKAEHIHIAIVVDEYGGTAGLVTLEDLLEEIVGEIQDEFDTEENPIRKLSQNVYLVEARLPIDEVNDAIGSAIPEEEAETLGGFIFTLAGVIPKSGDRFEYKNLLFVVEAVVGQRVKLIKVIVRNPDKEE
jgi:CBS domain containing-hemolysin-like protein